MKNLMTVVSQENIADKIYEMVLEGDITESMKTPGQFVHIRVTADTSNVLRRPISISDINVAKSQFTITYRADGDGTQKLTKIKAGDSIDSLTPPDTGYPATESAHALI